MIDYVNVQGQLTQTITHTHTCTHARMHASMHACTHACIHIHTVTHTCTIYRTTAENRTGHLTKMKPITLELYTLAFACVSLRPHLMADERYETEGLW